MAPLDVEGALLHLAQVPGALSHSLRHRADVDEELAQEAQAAREARSRAEERFETAEPRRGLRARLSEPG